MNASMLSPIDVSDNVTTGQCVRLVESPVTLDDMLVELIQINGPVTLKRFHGSTRLFSGDYAITTEAGLRYAVAGMLVYVRSRG